MSTMSSTSTSSHHKYHPLKLLLLLSTTIATYHRHHEVQAQICPTPPDKGGAFTYLCNPYEFNEQYYPGAQDWALAQTLVADVNSLGLCLKSPYGEDTAGIELWLVHYSSCEFGAEVDDCKACFEDARQIIKQHCPNKIGAQAASVHCCGRYEQYPFCKVVN